MRRFDNHRSPGACQASQYGQGLSIWFTSPHGFSHSLSLSLSLYIPLFFLYPNKTFSRTGKSPAAILPPMVNILAPTDHLSQAQHPSATTIDLIATPTPTLPPPPPPVSLSPLVETMGDSSVVEIAGVFSHVPPPSPSPSVAVASAAVTATTATAAAAAASTTAVTSTASAGERYVMDAGRIMEFHHRLHAYFHAALHHHEHRLLEETHYIPFAHGTWSVGWLVGWIST